MAPAIPFHTEDNVKDPDLSKDKGVSNTENVVLEMEEGKVVLEKETLKPRRGFRALCGT